jgi:hypothetical protein
MDDAPRSSCPGCGIVLPEVVGPTHAYIGASPACWQRYGEVLLREYSQVAPWEVHGTTVDAYAAQHPGSPGPRATQSVALHLVALMLRLHDGVTDAGVRQRLLAGAAASPPQGLRWLEPPAHLGRLTILDVLERDPDEHNEAVALWAGSVLEAWREHHATVRGWLDELRRR